ncbi:MAG: FtsX-like permease family protein [Bacteroidales bacterium]|nr:FtsX-like permease family protein [Bacteroidales bacterium]
MNTKQLLLRNISHYKPFYRLIAIAVIVAVAVITGSLVVGDSVRSTLIKRVEDRLGKTETVIFSRYSFLDDSILGQLNTDLHENDNQKNKISENPCYLRSESLRGILLMNGFVSVAGRFIPVMVWGVAPEEELGIEKGHAKINQTLFNEIKPSQTKDLVLRLLSGGMVPLGSMFVTDTYTTSLRLTLDSVIPVEQGGNINLKNEQTIPFNIFVNREELAEAMEAPGKINVILSDRVISKEAFSAAWNYTHSGLKVLTRHCGLDPQSPKKSEKLQVNPAMTIVSDRIFIQDQVVETFCKQDTNSNRIFAYLANSINFQFSIFNFQLHYPFITAVDYYKGEKLNPNEIILSDYAARRLNVKLNDTLSIRYFVSRQFKTLVEDSVFLRVGKIVPIEDLQSDKTLVAEFPGLSNVERCTDWNSDLPINMKVITDEDEDYWKKYKNTPKAIVPYSTLAPRWENAYGSATALHISDADCLNDLTPEMFDIQLIYPREAGIIAAKSGVDFSSLFLSLGCFIIISAAMLLMVPLSEMLFRRRDELNLLRATGFSNRRIARLLWRESMLVVFVSAVVGVMVGLAYTCLVLFLLGNVWKGATHTDGFRVYPDVITIAAGMLVGIVFSLSLLYGRIVRTLRQGGGKRTQMTRIFTSVKIRANQYHSCHLCSQLLSLMLIGLLVINIFYLKSPILFVCTGMIFLFAAWSWFDYLIRRGVHLKMPLDASKLMWSSLFHAKRQAMLSFFTLASGVFIVFSVGLNRQGFVDASQIRTATGGFSLWCETSVPVYHNIQTEEGRAKLGLTDLPAGTRAIQLLKYSADDASCLNLNKVVTPNVLGAPLYPQAPSGSPKGVEDGKLLAPFSQMATSMLCKKNTDDTDDTDFHRYKSSDMGRLIPALVDETVLQWSLGKKLGDTIMYMGEKGDTVFIQLAGTIQNSIFQGYILIDKTSFSEIWSEISGSEIMLLDVPDEEIANTKILLSQALNNYGVRVMTTGERLQLFHSVTDTYLTIFLTLGGLGLLLGIFSLVIVVRKNIVARLKEITLYRSLGFDETQIRHLLYKENIVIPLYAIAIGVLGSLLGMSMGFGNMGVGTWTLAVSFLAIFVFCVMVFVKKEVRKMRISFINSPIPTDSAPIQNTSPFNEYF